MVSTDDKISWPLAWLIMFVVNFIALLLLSIVYDFFGWHM